jgi:diguanylate cyclase (GGDEF)-like protein
VSASSPSSPPPLKRASPLSSRLFAWSITLLAVICSFAAAGFWRHQVRVDEQRSFGQEAIGVSSTVTSSLSRMDDLMIGVRSQIASNPGASNAALARWYESLDANRRYPSVQGFAVISPVKPSELQRFADKARANPIPGYPPVAKRFKVTPPGKRAEYCLISSAVIKHGVNAPFPPISLDTCATSRIRQVLKQATDTGQFRTVGFGAAGPGTVLLAAPFYKGGLDPGTRTARRTALRGWLTELIDVRAMIRGALAGHPGVRVKLQREDRAISSSDRRYLQRQLKLGNLQNSVETGAKVGTSDVLASNTEINADGRWTLLVRANRGTGGFSANLQALVVLLGGLLLSLALFLVLRSRANALALVEERTRELRYQALHDSLTGLPNRTLVLDRCAQMLARARRNDSLPAAMFVDLDDFKGVNDSLGHAAGDELLQQVARRISAELREEDTVGRFGGDEFVLLVEGTTSEEHVIELARRVLNSLSEPYVLASAEDSRVVSSASAGIATGHRERPDDLLREADIALYEEKSRGKHDYLVYTDELGVKQHDRLVQIALNGDKAKRG